MDWLTGLGRWILGLRPQHAIPILLLLALVLFRGFQLVKRLQVDRPPEASLDRLKLAHALARDVYMWIGALITFLLILAFQLAAYPLAVNLLYLRQLWLLVLAPYVVPLTIIICAALVAPKGRLKILIPTALVLLSPLWTYSYWKWINPLQVTTPGKIGIWVVPLEGWQLNPSHLALFYSLDQAARNSPAHVGILRETLRHAPAREQATEAQLLGLKVNATVVLWIVGQEDSEFLYATFSDSPTWDASLQELTTLQKDPALLLQYLLGMAYRLRGDYVRAIKHLEDIWHLNPTFGVELAYCYLLLGEQGQPEALKSADQYLRILLARETSDSFDTARMHYLAGLVYANLADVGIEEEFFEQHPTLSVRNREEALKEAESAFDQALVGFSEKTYPVMRGLTLAALGSALANRDVLLGDLEQRSQRASIVLDEALHLLAQPGLESDYDTARLDLAVSLHFNSLFTPPHERDRLLIQSIAHYNASTRTFSKKKDPSTYAAVQNDVGLAYFGLAAHPFKENATKALNAFKEAEDVAREHGLQDEIGRARLGTCMVSYFFDQSNLLREGVIACREAAQALRGRDSFRYANALVGLGDLHVRLAGIKLPGLDRIAILREARGAYRNALRALRGLPQKDIIRKQERLVRERIRDVENRIAQVQ